MLDLGSPGVFELSLVGYVAHTVKEGQCYPLALLRRKFQFDPNVVRGAVPSSWQSAGCQVRMTEVQLGLAVERIRAAVPSVLAVYLFGSIAAGNERADSDVDLAILAAHPLSSAARWNLVGALSSLLHRDVDLVDLRQASTVMRTQVIGEGRLLFEKNPTLRQEFEAVTLGQYVRLNEERRGILEDIRDRGSVYG